MRFDFKRDCSLPAILLRLLIRPWAWGIFFFCEFQHSSFDGCSAAGCDFGVLTEDERMSYYLTIFEVSKLCMYLFPFYDLFSCSLVTLLC